MNPFLMTAILLAGLTQASSGTAGVSGLQASTPSAGWAIPQSTSPSPVVARTVVTSGDSIIGLPLSIAQESIRDNVLVVPTPDLPPESLADLTQDLTVMCRIFGTAVPLTSTGKAPVRPARDNGTFYGIVIGPMTRGAQALYLDGYGALFFLDVDYPLVPTEPQEQPQATTQEPADAVWSRTVREMAGQAEEEPPTARNVPTYDPRRVEELRRALIKTLVHCANIRLPRPQDLVTLVVGDLDDSKRPNFRILPTTRYSVATTGPATPTAGPAQPGPRPPAATLLILRVTKADVDAFAKRQLTLDQFTEKVQVQFSPSGQGAPATSTTPPTPVGTRG